ncbi:histidine phosphatase superfamily [Aspergillus multicolor]|uniref:histidine phosphatase superfamily n=1 Tax=Aspergillus multicolor TaxID=41759 RepID=UPI003CCE4BEC
MLQWWKSANVNLGYQQNKQVGSDYRALYIAPNTPKRILSISEDEYLPSQIYAAALDDPVLLKSASVFLEGLYLTTSSEEESGHGDASQFTIIHKDKNTNTQSLDPSLQWTNSKTTASCPGMSDLERDFTRDGNYTLRVHETRPFYQSFHPQLQHIPAYSDRSSLSYENAYDIYDLLSTASIHNTSFQPRGENAILESDLLQLRTLADTREMGINFSPGKHYASIHGRTLRGSIVAHLRETVASLDKGERGKFSLFSGDYDSMLALFGQLGLPEESPYPLNTSESASGIDFRGLPAYASTMAFELFTEEDPSTLNASYFTYPAAHDSLRVRFLFRNGSDPSAPLTPIRINPVSYRDENDTSLDWSSFQLIMGQNAINKPEDWCSACESELPLCQALRRVASEHPSIYYGIREGMRPILAGITGSMVTLGVVGIAAAVGAFLLLRRWRRKIRARKARARGVLLAELMESRGSVALEDGESERGYGGYVDFSTGVKQT